MPKLDPNEPFTQKMLDQAVDAILRGVEVMFTKVGVRFDEVEDRLGKLELGQRFLKDEIKGLKADLSNTPSRGEFEQLKAKVDRHHPELRSL